MRSTTIATLLVISTVTLTIPDRALGEPNPSDEPAPVESGASAAPGQGAPAGTSAPQAAPPGELAEAAFTSANFEVYQPNADAVTYRPDLVPAGAEVSALSTSRPGGRATVLLTVQGLLPSHRYG